MKNDRLPVYLDHYASTPVLPEIVLAFLSSNRRTKVRAAIDHMAALMPSRSATTPASTAPTA